MVAEDRDFREMSWLGRISLKISTLVFLELGIPDFEMAISQLRLILEHWSFQNLDLRYHFYLYAKY